MKKQFIILISILAFFATSCQEDESLVNSLELTTGELPVQVSFSLGDLLETGSEVVPMNSGGATRADEQVKVSISSGVKVLLAKEVNGKWILDAIFDHVFNGTSSGIRTNITDSYVFKPILMTLRPGKYKVVLITGSNSMNWNANLVVGMELPEGENAPWACTYRMSTSGYMNIGKPSLEEEIFAGSKEFEVKKTEDGHSTVKDNNVSLTLSRKVARIRILLKKRTTGNMDPLTMLDFQTGVTTGIVAKFSPIDSNQKFSSGLNIWGEQQYQYYFDPEFKSTLYFSVLTLGQYFTGNDNLGYMLATVSGRQKGQYYFVETDQEIPVRMSGFEVSGQNGLFIYVYDDIIEGVSIKHNTTTGVIFESGNDSWGGSGSDERRNLVLVEEDGALAKPEVKFNNYYEYVN